MRGPDGPNAPGGEAAHPFSRVNCPYFPAPLPGGREEAEKKATTASDVLPPAFVAVPFSSVGVRLRGLEAAPAGGPRPLEVHLPNCRLFIPSPKACQGVCVQGGVQVPGFSAGRTLTTPGGEMAGPPRFPSSLGVITGRNYMWAGQ